MSARRQGCDPVFEVLHSDDIRHKITGHAMALSPTGATGWTAATQAWNRYLHVL